MDASPRKAYDSSMGRPLREAERIYRAHIETLPDEVQRQLGVLISEHVSGPDGGIEGGTDLTVLAGLGAEIWKEVDPDAYVNDLRDEWPDRP